MIKIRQVDNGFIMEDEIGGVYVFTNFTGLMNALGGIWNVCHPNERCVMLTMPCPMEDSKNSSDE